MQAQKQWAWQVVLDIQGTNKNSAAYRIAGRALQCFKDRACWRRDHGITALTTAMEGRDLHKAWCTSVWPQQRVSSGVFLSRDEAKTHKGSAGRSWISTRSLKDIPEYPLDHSLGEVPHLYEIRTAYAIKDCAAGLDEVIVGMLRWGGPELLQVLLSCFGVCGRHRLTNGHTLRRWE